MSTVEKALGVLDLFSETRPTIGLSEAARLLGRDKSTVQRHLADLCARGFLEQDVETRGYYLGPAIIRLAMVRDLTHPADKEIKAILDELVELTGETAHATQLTDGGLSCIGISETTIKGTRVYVDPSELLPFHASGSGIAYLAALPAEKAAKLITKDLQQFTRTTPVDPSELTKLVLQTRQRGYSLMFGTYETDVVGQAAAIRGYSGEPVGAIAIAVPTSRFGEEVERRNGSLLIEAARRASILFGGAATSAAAE